MFDGADFSTRRTTAGSVLRTFSGGRSRSCAGGSALSSQPLSRRGSIDVRLAADVCRENFVIWVPRGWLAWLMLAFVGTWLVSGGDAWPVVVLGWVLTVAGVGIGGWPWNRRDRGEDDQEGWI